MPIFEYQCSTCGKKIEQFLKASDDLDMYCPVCGGQMDMLYSAPRIHIFQNYKTRNILPHGKEVEIISAGQESSLLREYGLVKADSDPTK